MTPAKVVECMVASWPEQCSNVTCHEVSQRHVVLSHEVPAAAMRPGGYISGPMQFCLADLGMWCAVWGVLDRFEPMALTSELSIRFLRPAIGQALWTRVDVNSVGSRSVVSTATVWTDESSREKPCSVAQGTYVLPRNL